MSNLLTSPLFTQPYYKFGKHIYIFLTLFFNANNHTDTSSTIHHYVSQALLEDISTFLHRMSGAYPGVQIAPLKFVV